MIILEHSVPLHSDARALKSLIQKEDTEGSSKKLLDMVQKDLPATIHWIKREKVLFAIRNEPYLHSLSKAFEIGLKDASGQAQQAISERLADHELLLRILWKINAKLADLPIWKVSRRQAVYALLGMAEVSFHEVFFSFEAGRREQNRSSIFDSSATDAVAIRDLNSAGRRRMLDICLLALREILSRCPNRHTVYNDPVEAEWFQDLFMLAEELDFLFDTIDRYSYFDWRLTAISANEYQFRPTNEEEEEIMMVSSARQASADLQYQIELGSMQALQRLAEVAKERGNELLESRAINIRKILKPLSPEWELPIVKLIWTITASGSVLQALVASRDADPRVAEAYTSMIRAWEYLARIAHLYSIATEALGEQAGVRAGGLIRLTWSDLTEGFASWAHLPPREASSTLLRLSEAVSMPGQTLDLFLKPIVRVSNTLTIIPTSYVLMSRYTRNIVKLLVTESTFNPQSASEYLTFDLVKMFSGAGFSVSNGKGHKIYDTSGKQITDIDLAALKDGILFIIESRTVSVPDSRSEEYWAKVKLMDAAENAIQGAEYAQEHLAEILKWMGVNQTERITDIVPIVISNIRNFSGLQFGRTWITDDSSVGKLLTNPILSLRELDPVRKTERLKGQIKLIAGDVITGEEFKAALERPYFIEHQPEAGLPGENAASVEGTTFVIPGYEVSFGPGVRRPKSLTLHPPPDTIRRT
jgi:hypothetical protein